MKARCEQTARLPPTMAWSTSTPSGRHEHDCGPRRDRAPDLRQLRRRRTSIPARTLRSLWPGRRLRTRRCPPPTGPPTPWSIRSSAPRRWMSCPQGTLGRRPPLSAVDCPVLTGLPTPRMSSAGRGRAYGCVRTFASTSARSTPFIGTIALANPRRHRPTVGSASRRSWRLVQ